MESQQCYRPNHRNPWFVAQRSHAVVLIDKSMPCSELIRYLTALSSANALMTLMNDLVTC